MKGQYLNRLASERILSIMPNINKTSISIIKNSDWPSARKSQTSHHTISRTLFASTGCFIQIVINNFLLLRHQIQLHLLSQAVLLCQLFFRDSVSVSHQNLQEPEQPQFLHTSHQEQLL